MSIAETVAGKVLRALLRLVGVARLKPGPEVTPVVRKPRAAPPKPPVELP